jgi:Tol biopolymer transport system component
VDFLSSVISPDGRRIAFSGVSGTRQMLWVRDLDSLEAKPLNGTDGAAYPFWSPDSRSLGYFGVNKMKRIDILRGAAEDIAETRIPRGGAWSSRNTIVYRRR